MKLTVNHGALDGASLDINTGATGIQTVLDNMDAELQQLQVNWEGEAKEAYHIAKKQWTEGMDGMRQVLAQISRLVGEANASYIDTDGRGAKRFAV